MPNHVHRIIVIKNDDVHEKDANINRSGTVRAGSEPTLTVKRRHPLSEIIRQFKTFSARRINEERSVKGIPIWHRNYYEHIVRNDDELNKIRAYIKHNPANWKAVDYRG